METPENRREVKKLVYCGRQKNFDVPTFLGRVRQLIFLEEGRYPGQGS